MTSQLRDWKKCLCTCGLSTDKCGRTWQVVCIYIVLCFSRAGLLLASGCRVLFFFFFLSFVICELQCFMLGFIYLFIGLLSFNQRGMHETLLLFEN